MDDFMSFTHDDPESEVESYEEEDAALLTDVLAPWLKSPLPHAPPLVRLHNEIIGFCDHAKPTGEEMSIRDDLVKELSDIVAEIWPTATVHVFGSMMTNTLTPSSDVDICVLDVPGVGKKDPLELMLLLANHITSKNICSYIEAIQTAKVPIIKLDHRDSGIGVDICVMEDSGLVTGALVKEMVVTYPPVRPLTIVLKQFLAQRSLNEPYTGGVGSFMLSLMVVSFLQHRCRIEQHHNLNMSWNLGSLLMDFLYLYGSDSFNYGTTGISVTNFGKYFDKNRRSDWNKGGGRFMNNGGRQNFMLGLENPQMPEIDMGKGSFMMPKIRRALEHAKQLLSFALSDTSASSYLRFVIRTDDPMLQRKRESTVSRVVKKLNPSSPDISVVANAKKSSPSSTPHASKLGETNRNALDIGGKAYTENDSSTDDDDDDELNRLHNSAILGDELDWDDEDEGASSLKGSNLKKRKVNEFQNTPNEGLSEREKKKRIKMKEKEKERKKRRKAAAKLTNIKSIDLTGDSD
jgi:non-canonical poly(A) RNA polymerase PAPD5/7